MKISPIIHTRLYNCDYNLLVKPVDISANDLDFIKKHIFYSNKSMDFLDGERWVVIDNGDYRIAGLVGFLKDISNHCDLSLNEKEKSEKLFKDSKGRSIYGFIGIVIKDLKTEDKAIVPNYDYLWKLFLENISPVFDSSFPVSIDKEFGFDEYCVNSILSSDKSFNIPEKCKLFFEKRIVYISTSSDDYELFKHLLNFDNKDFSFCSNVSRIGDISDSIFSIITIPENCYCELERAEEEERKAKEKAEKEEEERKKREEEEEKARQEEEEAIRQEEEDRKKAKEAEEEAIRKAKEAEEEERRREEEERRRAEEEEEAEYRRKREERKKRQEEERRKAEEAEEEERKRREEERRKAEEAEEEEYRKKRDEPKRKQDDRDYGYSDYNNTSIKNRNRCNDFSYSDYNSSINKDKNINQKYSENQKRWLEEADRKERERQKELKRQEQERKRKLEEERQNNDYNWYNPDSLSQDNVNSSVSLIDIIKIIKNLINQVPIEYRQGFEEDFRRAEVQGLNFTLRLLERIKKFLNEYLK